MGRAEERGVARNMMIRALGPDGIRQRMAEIEARMEQLNPRQPAASFQSALDKAGSGGLSGQIGGAGYVPMSLGAAGVSVQPDSKDLQAMIRKAAESEGLSESLLGAVVSAESSGNVDALSGKRAAGLMQLMPKTARSLGVTNPLDPMQNLMGGAKYLKEQLDHFGGDVSMALAAYNAGPNRAKDPTRPWPSETVNYVNKVMRKYKGSGAG